ncbi:MAG TPA: aldehyde dehydrogenase family protein [Myxococcota bacterium]|nr:aldehyde dehydrogenase family protein [Myxococcota bacterium]
MSDPASTETFPHTDLDAIPATVERLRATFDAGRTRPLEWRRQQLERLLALLDDHGEEIVAALQADLRKPELEAWAADVGSVRSEAKRAIKKLARWTRPQRVGGLPLLGRSFIVHEPLGVVLIISPWNYPVQLLLSPLVGAIAAGNAVVLKPSEVTPHVSAVLARRVPDYLDPDAIALVEGGVEETTALLAERFDHIFYTGNGTVGRIVMEAAAKHLTPVTLELGGKSPCIVDDDVDVDVTARRIAWGKFMNAGQTCIAPDYVLVHEGCEDDLVEALGRAIREFYGDDPKASADFARIVNGRHQKRVARLLKDGDVVVGGQADESQNYVAPTLLRNVSPDSDAMREEIFGPVLPILKVKDVAEAIRFVNEREKPLALYVFSNDERVQQEVLDRTSSGGACVNGTILHLANPELPFGGVGPAGMGAYHGRHSFETFSHRKSVLRRKLKRDPKFMYPPYGKLKTRMAKRFS